MKSYFTACATFLDVFFSIFLLNIDTMVLKHPSPWLVPLSPGSCRVWSTCQDQDAGDGPTIDIMPWIIGMLDGLSRTSSTYCKSIRVHKKRAILPRYDKFVIGFKLFSEFVLEDFIFLLKVYNSIDFRSGGSLFSRYFDFSKSEPGLGRDGPRSLLFEKNASTWSRIWWKIIWWFLIRQFQHFRLTNQLFSILWLWGWCLIE